MKSFFLLQSFLLAYGFPLSSILDISFFGISFSFTSLFTSSFHAFLGLPLLRYSLFLFGIPFLSVFRWIFHLHVSYSLVVGVFSTRFSIKVFPKYIISYLVFSFSSFYFCEKTHLRDTNSVLMFDKCHVSAEVIVICCKLRVNTNRNYLSNKILTNYTFT